MDFKISEDGLILIFDYERELVNKIKKIQGVRFDAIERGWLIPYYSIEKLNTVIEIPKNINKKIKEKIKTKNNFIDKLDLKEELRPFQKDAVGFLVDKQKSMLCADMGLGKTCMSIAYAKYLLDRNLIKKVLVFCPKTLKEHWNREIDKFIDADVTIIGTKKQQRIKSWINAVESRFVIMNYEQIFDEQSFLNIKNILRDDTLIILDEATRIKNINAKTSSRIKTFKSKYKVILTGRPVENRPEELFSINGFLENSLLGSWDFFKGRYIVYDNFGGVLMYQNLHDLGNRIKQIMFRCKKEDVLKDLPEKIVNTYQIELSPSEKVDYNFIENMVESEIKLYKKRESTIRNVLAIMQLLKMYCDHPVLVDKSESITAMGVTVTSKNNSKLDELLNVLKELSDKKIVIFSQYTKMCDILKDELDKNGYSTVKITGEDNEKYREEKIRLFEKDKQILICSDVMSYGVNLQFASVVINYDLAWNPAKNEQRIARLHRMGQKNVVNVVNLTISDEDKIEQKIKEILEIKDTIFDEIME